jgi:7-carboxy-7-deazaguanine synthase
MSTLSVNEIFGPTFQGEGPEIGRRVLFVRLAGCDYRCSWCDTKYALRRQNGSDWKPLEILSELMERTMPGAPTHVVLTGGNPFLQPAVGDLLDNSPLSWVFHAETQGSIWQEWANHYRLHHIVVSPKLSNSGVDQDPESVGDFIYQTRAPQERVSLKIVVFDMEDVMIALDDYWKCEPDVRDWILQVGTVVGEPQWQTIDRWRTLAEEIAANVYKPIRLLPQTHVLLWGQKRGV